MPSSFKKLSHLEIARDMARYISSRDNTRRIFVTNLPEEVREYELEYIFGKYGRVVGVDLFSRKSPPFAFVEFEKEEDAEDAVKHLDRSRWGGTSLWVGHPKGYKQRRSISPKPRGFRIQVDNLPMSTSCEDLKNHLKRAGSITHAEVCSDGTGFVHFLRRDEMEYAVKNYDNTEIKTDVAPIVEAPPQVETRDLEAAPHLDTRDLEAAPHLETRDLEADPHVETRDLETAPHLETRDLEAAPHLETPDLETRRNKSADRLTSSDVALLECSRNNKIVSAAVLAPLNDGRR
ncbi:SRSF1 [Cordylochernes scorpioides]|uniref:SRSF1 n=1 Tax=Cordylochernes scorpioides TaxID=51811 RepID=A0ABY6KSY2_9ARAC|nr:SRSF1 [Cordylochernes scorpioides]